MKYMVYVWIICEDDLGVVGQVMTKFIEECENLAELNTETQKISHNHSDAIKIPSQIGRRKPLDWIPID